MANFFAQRIRILKYSITVDKNLVHQQRLTGLQIAVVVMRAPSSKIEDLSPLVPEVLAVLPGLKKGQIVHVG